MTKKRILLADDEPDILLILRKYLERDGYDVTTCSNGREALEQSDSAYFDLFILDVMMPEINGWEVCKKIKNDPVKGHTPVIILTARSQSVDQLMSFESGADEYSTKPFDYDILSPMIKGLIEKTETSE